MPYVAPGAAFTNSLEQTMLQQAAARRQAELDQQEAQQRADAHLLAEEHLKELKDAATTKADDKKKAKIERTVANMVPGDIPDAALIAQAKDAGIPLATTTAVPQGVSPEVSPVQPTIDARRIGGPAPVVPPPAAQPIRFAGDPAARIKAEERQKQLTYIDSLPDGPEKQAARYQLETGHPAPAGMFKSVTSTDKAIMRQNPSTGAVETMVNGKFVPYTGNGEDIQGAHWMTEPAPKDNSAAGARENTRMDNNYKSAITELEKAAAPIASHLDSLETLGTALEARTPTADALIAPLVLKATVSGAGTGFRMTQSEINQVIGARSKWETLKAALMKWDSDPSKALSITDEQRTELRELAKAIQTKATKTMAKLTKAREDLDNADDVETIHRTMTKLKSELYTPASETPATSKTTADYLKMLEQP